MRKRQEEYRREEENEKRGKLKELGKREETIREGMG